MQAHYQLREINVEKWVLKGLSRGAVHPSGKRKQLIILHIDSEDGFIPKELLCFESKKKIQATTVTK